MKTSSSINDTALFRYYVHPEIADNLNRIQGNATSKTAATPERQQPTKDDISLLDNENYANDGKVEQS